MAEHGQHGGGYERRDADPGALGWLIAGLGALVVIGMVVSWLAFRYFDARHAAAQPERSPLAEARAPLPPEPRLQEHPSRDLEQQRRAEQAVLESYDWVDRDAGIARIPIERAIEILAERGLPARPASPQDSPRPEQE